MTRGKKPEKPIKKTLVCSDCGQEKDLIKEFYASSSPFHKHTGRLSVCKDCFWNFVSDDIDKLKIALRMVDKAFLTDLLKSSQEEITTTGKSLIPTYMKNLSMPQYKNHTWDDSDFDSFKSSRSIEVNDKESELNNKEVVYLKTFWGKGYDTEDLIWLQSEYEDWINRYECDSKGMETLIQEICKQQLDINIRRSNGEKVDQQLKTLQDLLGSSNLKPVQETGANAVEQETFGTLIKKFEREKPIPEPDPEWKDVDGIGKYIRTFFFGHMAKAIGAENKFQDEYDKEIAKYTIEQVTNDGDFDE